MELWLWIILAALFFECKGEDRVIQRPEDVTAAEGDTVTLDCEFETTYSGSTLFWYKQEANSFPQYMLRCVAKNVDKAPELDQKRFHAEIKNKSVPLKIQKLQVSDSAVYYCALQPNAFGDKLIFGSGSKLTVESSADYEPLYYELESNETKACLATGFSKHDAAKNKSAFRNEEAARPSKKSWDGSLEDALYSSVALISKSAEKCEEGGRPTKPCGDFLEKDPTVNAVSLTILGLRLLFIKTIVFNVLITLRFWMSQ